MHMGIPVCVRAGIAKKFAYGDPITNNEVVRIRGLTYINISRTSPVHTTTFEVQSATPLKLGMNLHRLLVVRATIVILG